MKVILVDDEPIMIKSFIRQASGIELFSNITTFNYPEEALDFAKNNQVDVALLDISMPQMTGIELAKELQKLRDNIIIVFISAHDNYVRESNQLNADSYIVKPYTRTTIEQLSERIQLLSKRQEKEIYVQMFGRFNVFKDGKPVPLVGKAKEILALVASRNGKEISNEEIYSTIWENRGYSNEQMKVYYNALRRLKDALKEGGVENILISTQRGQIFNTEIVDCDYYSWKNSDSGTREKFEGEFLTEYSWGEVILAGLLNDIVNF